jgi:hypothetical protein
MSNEEILEYLENVIRGMNPGAMRFALTCAGFQPPRQDWPTGLRGTSDSLCITSTEGYTFQIRHGSLTIRGRLVSPSLKPIFSYCDLRYVIRDARKYFQDKPITTGDKSC